MDSVSPAAATALPRPFLAALLVLAAFGAMLIWDQATWWGSKDEYMFGYLVPLFVAYIVYDRWAKVRTLLQPAAAALAPAWLGATARLVASAALIGGLVFFFFGAFYQAGAGTSQPGSLAIAMGTAAVALGLIYLAVPVPATATHGDSRGFAAAWRALIHEPRWLIAGQFLFPATVWMVSAPLVSAVENSLSTFLLGKVTIVVFSVFDLLGYPIERQGSTLLLPLGQVGVAEACSGIRSLTGSIFSGCFLAAAFLPTLGRKVGLVFAAVILAFLMNIVRSLVLTGIAYAKGPAAIEGSVHDITGFAVLGGTFLGLLALLPLFGREAAEPAVSAID